MSLINKALKDEQRRRSGDEKPLSPSEVNPIPIGVRRRGRESKNIAILLTLCGGGVLSIGLIAGALYYGSQLLDFSTPKVSSPSLEAEQAATDVAATAGTVSDSAEAAPIPSFLEGIDLESEETPAPEVEAVAVPVEKKAPPGDPIIQSYINDLVVHGVRSAGANSRLLMSGRVFKVGDLLDPRKGVRFTGVAGGQILFEDENGATYLRSK